MPSYLKLNGKTTGDLSSFTCLDPTIADGKSSFVSGILLKKEGGLSSRAGLVANNTFNEYKELVSEKYKEMDKKLRNNSFDISPLSFGDRDNACQYCEYKDICYIRKNQMIEIKKEDGSDE